MGCGPMDVQGETGESEPKEAKKKSAWPAGRLEAARPFLDRETIIQHISVQNA